MRNGLSARAWALFLLFSGIFLLLKNLGIFDPWGEAIWGGSFILLGLVFLAWLARDSRQWWRAIPAFTLFGIGAVVLMDWQGVALGGWRQSIVLLGVGLGFWSVLLLGAENWWATLPAGVLTLLAVLLGLQESLSPAGWMALFFAGLGAVFGLVYLRHPAGGSTRWAAVPAAALVLLGAVSYAGSLPVGHPLATWWPLLLAVAGIFLLALSFRRPAPAPVSTTATLPPPEEEIPPAPGASMVTLPPASSARSPEGNGEVDIYEVIRNQPKE